jgi:L-idonate 5-dehydrogenase
MSLMKGYVLHGAMDLRLESMPIPAPSADSVLIKVARSGICGSDIHYFSKGKIGSFVPKSPFVPGHEFVGEIAEAGKSVTALSCGDRVAVEPSIACGCCGNCKKGRYNLCVNSKFIGTASSFPHLNGGFAEYVVVPARNCYRLPDRISYDIGALVEPLAVGTHAVLRAGNVAGKSILITGGGTIGQTVMIIARAFGATRIAVSDIDEFCRQFSRTHGADAAFDPSSPDFEGEVKAWSPGGFDLVFEASGSPAALKQGILSAARGATLVQIGTQPDEVSLPINQIMAKELQLLGSFRYANVYEIDLELLMKERVRIDHLVTHVFGFDDFLSAMETAVKGENTLKIQIVM